MLIDVDTSDDRPIYAQIVDRVKFAVAAGVLRPGEMVPSVRELSKQLLVNPNTVARAYRDLQAGGLLEPVRGTGLQVTGEAPGRCRAERQGMVRRRLRAAMEEALRSGMDLADLEAMIREEWARSRGAAGVAEGDPTGRRP